VRPNIFQLLIRCRVTKTTSERINKWKSIKPTNRSSGANKVIKKTILAFATLALAVATAANTYHVTFFQPVVVNGQTLKAGDYKIQYSADKATIQQGKTVAEVPVKVENGNDKFSETMVRMNGQKVEEIRLGGTHTKLIFENAPSGTN
jgi:hypothetical protein